MKVKFLGTSSGWPLPRLGHHCEICDSTDPKDKRTRSQVLVNETILVDAGPDTYWHLIKEPEPQKISSVLITHGHPDHTFGLWDLNHVYEKEKKLDIFASEVTFKKINRQGIDLEAMNKHTALPFEEYEVNGVKTTFFPVNHSKTIPANGIRLVESRKRFVYIPDFGSLPKESRFFLKNADLLILDGSSLELAGPKGWGHETIPEGIELSKKLKAKTTYFTHIGHGKISRPHVQLEAYAQEHGGTNFHIAYDGLEISL